MLHGFDRAQGISPKFTASRCVPYGITPRAALIGPQQKSSDRTTNLANASSMNELVGRVSGESWDADDSH